MCYAECSAMFLSLVGLHASGKQSALFCLLLLYVLLLNHVGLPRSQAALGEIIEIKQINQLPKS
jgi:hypothetical protein